MLARAPALGGAAYPYQWKPIGLGRVLELGQLNDWLSSRYLHDLRHLPIHLIIDRTTRIDIRDCSQAVGRTVTLERIHRGLVHLTTNNIAQARQC